MTNIFTNSPAALDFEEGNLSDWDTTGTNGSAAIEASSTQAHEGTYSTRAYSAQGSEGERAFGRKSVSWPIGDVVYFRFYLYVDDAGTNTYPAGHTCGGLRRSDSLTSTSADCQVHMRCSDTTLELHARDSDSYQDTEITFQLSKDTWYEIEVKYDLSGTNAKAEMWVDGDSKGTWTGSGLPANDPDRLVLGSGDYNYHDDIWANLYIDDVQCEDARIGGGASATLSAAASLSAQSKSLASATLAGAASLSASPTTIHHATVTTTATAALSCSPTTPDITPTLLAACLSWKGAPTINLEVQDLRHRWALLHYADASTQWSDQAADGTAIHRVTSDSSGNIHWCKVTNPTTAAQWTNWQILVSTAIANSEVAIAVYSTDNLHAYYIAEGAGDTWDIRCKPYIDATWNDPVTVLSSLNGAKPGDAPEPPRIAACNGLLFYTDTGLVKAIPVAMDGTPGTPVTWTALGTLDKRNGIGAARDGSYARVAVAGAGNLTIGHYNAVSNAWTAYPIQIAPGGSATAANDSALTNPSLEIAGGLYLLTYLDTFTAAFAEWDQPVLLQSTNWPHFGNELALGLGTSTSARHRVSLAHITSTRTTYAANQKCVLSSTLYHTSDSTKHLQNLPVSAYSRDTTPRGSTLTVHLLNRHAVYDDAGRDAATAQAIKPLSTIIVRRGYHTSLGPETLPLDPHYITRATVQKGRNYRHLVIEAADGWGLLRLWHPNETLTWTSKSISWLMAEIAARVGLTVQDNATTYTAYQIPTFTVPPSQDGSAALADLLRLAGCVAYFDPAGTLQVYNLYSWSPDYVDIGDATEILRGDYSALPFSATSFRVFGDDASSAGETCWNSMELGIRINRNVEDLRITTDAQAQVVRRLLYTLARTSHRHEVLSFPMRPDLHLWQRVRLFPPGDVIPPSDCLRRIVRLRESFSGPRNRYLTTITTTYT